MTFVHQQAALLEQKSTTIEGLSAMVEEQAMTNKRQSTLIHQYGSQTQVPVFKYLLNKKATNRTGHCAQHDTVFRW